MMQACEDKYEVDNKREKTYKIQRRVYLNYAGVACGCLWVHRESIRLENHSG